MSEGFDSDTSSTTTTAAALPPADPKVAEPAAVHEYGVSCGGRRQLKSPGYQYKDCSDEFPGHY